MRRGLACLVIVASVLACTLDRRLIRPDETRHLDGQSKILKAHMRDGHLYLLQDWSVDERGGMVIGKGDRFDENRDLLDRGTFTLRLADVALFETNTTRGHPPAVLSMALVTGASLVVTAACLTNPKACFGSCPTTYVDDGSSVVAAESFSASVAPSLETEDIDALYRARPSGRTVRLRVTNEALETHVIRRADLLVAPRPSGGRVLADGAGRFWQARTIKAPTACRAAEGDCLAAVAAVDDRERASAADSRDLAARETIELAFVPPRSDGRLGLVLEARQTFITTYLFYQALAYMGRQAGTMLASLERGDPALHSHATRLHHLLGGVEVEARDDRGRWRVVGRFDETGPIAREVQVIPLPRDVRADAIRLRVARGHYRIGHVALAELGEAVTPTRLRPARLETRAGDAAAASAWFSGAQPALVTGPGDEHLLEYALPDEAERLELFLAARGYYIEWMREAWLAEESPRRLAALFHDPERALRDLAPAYKRVEPVVEDLFWRSRYVRPAR